MSSSELRYQDVAWLLLEPKTTFYSPHYRKESLFVRNQVLPFWSQPQVVLQLGQIEYLVLNSNAADACKRSGDLKETKKLLQLTVRAMDDVRCAQLYQTAAQAQVLEVFVDGEKTRERLLRCLRGEKPAEKLLNEAFVALEKAQQSVERETAIGLYKQAERGFWEAEKVVADVRSIELLKERRGDLQRTIRGLEEADERMRSAAAVVMPPQVEEVTSTLLTMDISARLEELRHFAAKQDDANALQDNRADLAGRLAALKNEMAGPAMPADALAERLRRLRGPAEGASMVRDSGLERKSAVDRVIEQVADEIALGIEDEDNDADEAVEESDSSGSSDINKSNTSST